MTILRPAQHISVLALGIHFRGGKILASEVRDDNGNLKGVRPLGGHVEFTETWQEALTREFKEELGVAVSIKGAPFFMENLFVHHDKTGHEIVILAEVRLPKGAFEGAHEIVFREDNDTEHVARWYGPDELLANDIPLFPEGLFGEVFGG